jgi:hypothetical protein
LADQTPSQFLIIADLPPILTFSGHTTTLANLSPQSFFAYQFSSAARGGNGRTVAITVGCYNPDTFNIPELRFSRYVTVKGVFNTDPFITCLQAIGIAALNYEIQGITGSNQCDYCEYAAFNCPLVTPTPNLACIDGYFQITTTAPPLTTAMTTGVTTTTSTTAPLTSAVPTTSSAPVVTNPFPLYPLTVYRLYIERVFQQSLNPNVIVISIAGSSAPNTTSGPPPNMLPVTGIVTLSNQTYTTYDVSPGCNSVSACVNQQVVFSDPDPNLPLVLSQYGYNTTLYVSILQVNYLGYQVALAYSVYNADTSQFDTFFNFQVGLYNSSVPTTAIGINFACYSTYNTVPNTDPYALQLHMKIPPDAVGFFCYWTAIVGEPTLWTTPGPLPAFTAMVDQFVALRNIPLIENIAQFSISPSFIFSVNISRSEVSGTIRTYYTLVYFDRYTQYIENDGGYFSNQTPDDGLYPATNLLGYPNAGFVSFTGNLANVTNATIIAMKLRERDPSTGRVESTIARVICYNINTGLMNLSYEVRTGPQPYNNFFNCVHDVGRGVVYPPTINVTNHCGFCQYAVLYCTNVISPATCASNYLS